MSQPISFGGEAALTLPTYRAWLARWFIVCPSYDSIAGARRPTDGPPCDVEAPIEESCQPARVRLADLRRDAARVFVAVERDAAVARWRPDVFRIGLVRSGLPSNKPNVGMWDAIAPGAAAMVFFSPSRAPVLFMTWPSKTPI